MKNTNYQKIAVVLLTLIGMSLAPVLFAEEEKTVLERVKIVDDPELAEIIRITKRNLPQSKLQGNPDDRVQRSKLEYEVEIAEAKAIRTVTEIYSQIKLLDEKIKQINIRIDRSKTTKDIESELLLAKSTLEAERLTKIAELRETMNWTPWTPFGFKENEDLNAWINLEVLDGVIRLSEFKKPFYNGLDSNGSTKISFFTYDESIKHLENIYKRSDTWPIRITLSATKEGDTLANELRERIKLIAKNAKADFQTDLAYGIRTLTTEHSSLLVENNERIRYENVLLDGSVQSLAGYIKDRLQRPGALPRIYQIAYREDMKDKAKELEDALNAVIKELGYTKYVQVENKGLTIK